MKLKCITWHSEPDTEGSALPDSMHMAFCRTIGCESKLVGPEARSGRRRLMLKGREAMKVRNVSWSVLYTSVRADHTLHLI